jgi:hypothetical protein
VVYDVDDEGDKDNLDKQEVIGEMEIPFNELSCSNDAVKRDIQPFKGKGKKSNKSLGKIIVKAFESDICQTRVKFLLAVEDMATRNQIMISIKGSSNNKEYFMIHNTPRRKNTAKGCVFPEFSVNSNKIGEESSNLKFEFYEIKKSVPKLVGELEISLISLYNYNNKKISIYRNAFVVGKLRPTLTRDDNNNFLNYISDGYYLKLIISVDFCSRSKQSTSGDLSSPEVLGLYKRAIMEVGTLLKYYDSDSRTVALGFGAKLKPYLNVVSHCFALNGNYFHPEIESLEKVCEAIDSTLGDVELHGPKIISESIRYASDIARSFKTSQPK